MNHDSASKESNGAVCPIYMLRFIVSPLQNNMDQELFKKYLGNQSSHYENMDDFHYERKPSCASYSLFAVGKDEWNTKENIGKSMKNTLYFYGMPKGPSWAEAMSNSKKSSP